MSSSRKRGLARLLALGLLLAVIVVVVVGRPGDDGDTRDGSTGVVELTPPKEASIIDAGANPAGQPVLEAFETSYSAVPTALRWFVCTPRCGPVVSTERRFLPGPTKAGTTFELRAVADGAQVFNRVTWSGRLRNTQSPRLDGGLGVGQGVIAKRGRWRGGWANSLSRIGVLACANADGSDCYLATHSIDHGGHAEGLTLTSAYVGWYLRAVEVEGGHSRVDDAMARGPLRAPREGRAWTGSSSELVALGAIRGPVG